MSDFILPTSAPESEPQAIYSPKDKFSVLVKNLPKEFTDEQLFTHFNAFRPVRHAFVVTDKGKAQSSRGFGFVMFSKPEDAASAIEEFDGAMIGSHAISVVDGDRSKKRLKPKKPQESRPAAAPFASDPFGLILLQLKPSDSDIPALLAKHRVRGLQKYLFNGPEGRNTARLLFEHEKNATFCHKVLTNQRRDLRVDHFPQAAVKLIVRNLPFTATAKQLRRTFSKFGEIVDIKLPLLEKKPLNRGFAFVHFRTLAAAWKVMDSEEEFSVCNRQIAVDWALSKNKFQEATSGTAEEEAMEPEEEPSDSEEASEEDGEEESESGTAKRNFPASNEKTVFVSRIPFTVTEASLLSVFKAFGWIEYIKIVKNKSGFSTGNAFIKFRSEESVEKVLAEEVAVDSVMLSVKRAVSREEIEQLKEKKVAEAAQKNSDKRNLYLLSEGVITAADPGAKGLTAAELEHRENLYRVAKKKLENTNFSVSKVRLSVHNLPLNLNEKRLKQIFLAGAKKSKSKPKIVQVKISRDEKRVTESGEKRSKRFGFVEFSDHESALCALRSVNNNPNLLPKRLIVSFAIDDQRKLHKRKLRLESWKKNNATPGVEFESESEGEEAVAVSSEIAPAAEETEAVSELSGEAEETEATSFMASFEAETDEIEQLNSAEKLRKELVSVVERAQTENPTQPNAEKKKRRKRKRKKPVTTESKAPASEAPVPVKSVEPVKRMVPAPKKAKADRFDEFVTEYKGKYFGAEKLKKTMRKWYDV